MGIVEDGEEGHDLKSNYMYREILKVKSKHFLCAAMRKFPPLLSNKNGIMAHLTSCTFTDRRASTLRPKSHCSRSE